MQLDVRARALMSVEEIKCPHKGFDSGGLRCFLSRAWWCDNCFSNIRNLPPSKSELKKRRGKNNLKKKNLHQRGRASGQGLNMAQVCVSHNPTASQQWSSTALLKMERKYSCVIRQQKMPLSRPHTVTRPERKGHQQWVSYSSQIPCVGLPGFHQHVLLKWGRSCWKPEGPGGRITRVFSPRLFFTEQHLPTQHWEAFRIWSTFLSHLPSAKAQHIINFHI